MDLISIVRDGNVNDGPFPYSPWRCLHIKAQIEQALELIISNEIQTFNTF